MAEQWEHMLVSAIGSLNPAVHHLSTDEANHAGQPSASSTTNLLNELGEKGWQLVHAAPSDDLRTGRYWLKRRVVPVVDYEPGGDWAGD
jgi:hypothetical protein